MNEREIKINSEVAWDAGNRLLMGKVIEISNGKLTVEVYSSDRRNFKPGKYIVNAEIVTVF